jgi:hypothetical protein
MICRLSYLLGLLAPLLFVFTVILGGTLRPGYSHVLDTMNELFSPGSPNRQLLSALYTIFAVMLSIFGFGLLQFVQEIGEYRTIGIIATLAFVSVGVISILSATLFPQDAWGSTPTLPGRLHIILHGIISLLSFLYMLLFGVWFRLTRIAKCFLVYSLVTVVAASLTAGWFVVSSEGQLMGVAERAATLIEFQWIIVLAVVLLKND